MDERVARLKTPEEREQFAANVQALLPELAQAARQWVVEIRAAAHGAEAAEERDVLAADFAYKRVLPERKGKEVRASRPGR